MSQSNVWLLSFINFRLDSIITLAPLKDGDGGGTSDLKKKMDFQ